MQNVSNIGNDFIKHWWALHAHISSLPSSFSRPKRNNAQNFHPFQIHWENIVTKPKAKRSNWRGVTKLDECLTNCMKLWFCIFSVKQRAKNMVLYSAFIASVAVLCGMCYLMYEQIFSPGSPQSVFSKSLTAIRTDPECKYFLGEKIKGYGEETYRGRRRHLAHHLYTKVSKQSDNECLL